MGLNINNTTLIEMRWQCPAIPKEILILIGLCGKHMLMMKYSIGAFTNIFQIINSISRA